MTLDFESLEGIENVITAINNRELIGLPLNAINKRHGAFRDAARLQALVTLARLSIDKSLCLTASDSIDKSDLIAKLSNYAPGIVALRLNKTVKINSVNVTRREGLQGATAKMLLTDKGDYDKIIKGRSIDINCVSGADIQYLSALFSERQRTAVKENTEMTQTMNSIFKKVNQFDFNDTDGKLNDAFGVFTSELFKNTQEHAYTDQNNRPYIEHVEGLIATGDFLSEVHEKDFTSNPKLQAFWDKESLKSSDGVNKLKCRQISFFDTGPGLVGRGFPNIQFESYEHEKDALIECIKHSFTTKKQSGAGEGYPTILSHLSRVGGLIRIRSGNQCIFRCFDTEEHDSWNVIQSPEERALAEEKYLTNFENWFDEELSPALGTVVSILVPLRNEGGQRNLF
jgi:hypothetical protein